MDAQDFLRQESISDETKINLTLIQWDELYNWMRLYAEYYHEAELKKLRVADVIKNEVAVCERKDEWLREIRLNVMRCKKCGTEF